MRDRPWRESADQQVLEREIVPARNAPLIRRWPWPRADSLERRLPPRCGAHDRTWRCRCRRGISAAGRRRGRGHRALPGQDPRAHGPAAHPRPGPGGGRRRPGGVAAGVRLHGQRRGYAGHRRHHLQRPVDVEDVHRHGSDAGGAVRTARPRRADHDLPARLHGPQRLRAAPRAADHAADAAELHRRLHPRGAARQQLRAGARRLRRARAQHLRHLAAVPGRGPATRTRTSGSTSPATSSSRSPEALPGRHARLAARAAGHGSQHLRPGPGARHRRPGGGSLRRHGGAARGRPDDGGRRAVVERRGPRPVPASSSWATAPSTGAPCSMRR